MAMNIRRYRVEDELWEHASARAFNEGTNLSTLIRQWMQNYVNQKEDVIKTQIKLTKAEREALCKQLSDVLDTWLT